MHEFDGGKDASGGGNDDRRAHVTYAQVLGMAPQHSRANHGVSQLHATACNCMQLHAATAAPGIEMISWSWPCFLACAACHSLLAYCPLACGKKERPPPVGKTESGGRTQ